MQRPLLAVARISLVTLLFVAACDGRPVDTTGVGPRATSSPETTNQTPQRTLEGSCRCTRRPGKDDFQCPKGADETVTSTIDSAGGKVVFVGQQGKASGVPFSLDSPPKAYAAATVVRVTETSIPPPADFVDFSPVYLVEADATPVSPVNIVVPWGNRSGSVGSALSIYTASTKTATPEPVPDSYVNAGFMQGSVRTFGLFFAGYPKAAENACQ